MAERSRQNMRMNKAFVRGSEEEDEAEEEHAGAPPTERPYISKGGFARLQAELRQLLGEERPRIVETVSWAAKNGDRSENGDYLYGKKRLREIDRRIRFLTRRLAQAEIVDASVHNGGQRVFFGATVTYQEAGTAGEECVTILGRDECEGAGQISWVSPLARALLGAEVGQSVRFVAPQGTREITIRAVRYPKPEPN